MMLFRKNMFFICSIVLFTLGCKKASQPVAQPVQEIQSPVQAAPSVEPGMEMENPAENEGK
jgi:predicted component of type VI protein secretion system